MKGSELDDSSYSGKETFNVEQKLAREKGVDLIGVDPKTLSFSEKLRQRNQQRNAGITFEATSTEPDITQINAYEESKGPLSMALPQSDTSVLFVGSTSNSKEAVIHFPSIDQEIKEIMVDIDIPEVEYVREPTINVLPGKKRALRLYSDSSDLAKTRSKAKKKPGKSGKYKPVEPNPIEEGFILLAEAIPPEDYHAIRQNPKYNQFLKRDEHRRVLVRVSEVEALLTLKNSRYSNQELEPDQGLLHLFGKTQEEKSALLEAASHGRIAAVRKKDGWYTTAKVAEAFLKSREVPNPNQRPMTKQEVVRYRDFLKSGTFPARKVKNRWHTSDEEIIEFEVANPSKRKVNLPNI